MKIWFKQVQQSFSYLDRRDKSRLLIAIFGQIVLALLDMAGAAGLGLIGAIAAVSITNSVPPISILKIEDFLQITNFPVTKQIGLIGLGVMGLFIGKTLGSLYLNRRVLYFLATKQVVIASDIWRNILRREYLSTASYSRQELVQAVTDSLNVSITGVLGNFLLVISELILLALLLVFLGVVYPSMAILILLAFGSLAYITQSRIGKKTRERNSEYSRAAVASKTSLMDSLAVLSEIKVLGHSSSFVDKFGRDRALAANAYVESIWLGQVPKYVLETGLVLSGILLFFFTQATSTAVEAISQIVVFLAVSGRLVPSILRLQSVAIGMHASVGIADSINTLYEKLNLTKTQFSKTVSLDLEDFSKKKSGTSAEVHLKNVIFGYEEGAQQFYFDNLYIRPGRSVAVIGKSGVGKTTLVQLILGLLEPDSGKVSINEKLPKDWIEANHGSVSYLPQSVALISGNIEENIALGVPSELIDQGKLLLAVKIAALETWVQTLPLGLKTNVSENGLNFSGGQIQRIGIARAVYDRPGLIVLDEPTSSLDEDTERVFFEMLELLHGKTTFVIITHNLAMLEHIDDVLLLEENADVVTARLMDSKSALSLKGKRIFEE